MDSTLTALRSLQPASAECVASRQHYHGPTKAPKAKRRPALGACIACRERKSKCDGHRPACQCCVNRKTDCLYELGVNERPSEARKRRNEGAQRELLDFRHLYSSLRSCPEDEALEILHRIRVSPSDTLSLECLSSVPRALAQRYSYRADTDSGPITEEAGPWSYMASPSFRSAGELDRFFDPAPGLPTECTARQHTSMPNASGLVSPHSRGSLLPRTSIGFILQASPEDAPRMDSQF